MRESNLGKGLKLAKLYKKKYGVITYSGTMAIEVVLKSLNLHNGDNVLISSNVCYSIANAIIRNKLNVMITTPKNSLSLTSEDVIPLIEGNEIKVIILVHQFGIVSEIKKIKELYPNIIIIEDIAQAWNIVINKDIAGAYSDFLVTSFGTTKPLSYGIGGAILSNNDNFIKYLDFCDNESRNAKNDILPYVYPLSDEINVEELVVNANIIVEEQRNVASSIINIINKQSIIKYYKDIENNNSVWHRFPIWVDDLKDYKWLIKQLEKYDVKFQFPHEIDLEKLYLTRDSIFIHTNKKNRNMILIRTRNIDLTNLVKSFSEIVNKIVDTL